MIPLAAVVGAATAIGIGAERRLGPAAGRAADRVLWTALWVVLPVVAFFNVAALEPTREVGAGIAYGFCAQGMCLAAAYAIGRRVLGLSGPRLGALMAAAAFANTGYLGLPFNAALLGLDSLPDAIAYDVIVSGVAGVTAAFAVGAAFGTAAQGARERAVAFLVRNPPLWATAAGLAAPRALAPDWAVDASQVLVFAILPLGFFAVGVTLASSERVPLRGPVATALVLKLLLAPAVVLALSVVVVDVPAPYHVQPAMATALLTVLVAKEYGLDRPLVATAIAWSTGLVVIAGLLVALV